MHIQWLCALELAKRAIGLEHVAELNDAKVGECIGCKAASKEQGFTSSEGADATGSALSVVLEALERRVGLQRLAQRLRTGCTDAVERYTAQWAKLGLSAASGGADVFRKQALAVPT